MEPMTLLFIVFGLILVIVVGMIWILAKNQKEDPTTNDKLTEDIEKFAKKLEPQALDLTGKQSKGLIAVQKDKEKEALVKVNGKPEMPNSPFSWVPVATEFNEESLEEKTVLSAKPTVKKVKPKSDELITDFNLSVLLVDDSPTVLNFIGKMLTTSGYSVITKIDGQEALNYLKEDEAIIPDIIISDIEMPNMDGISLIENLRKIKKYERVPIIIISANAEKHLTLMSKGLIQGFLHKPFKGDDLLSQLIYVASNT